MIIYSVTFLDEVAYFENSPSYGDIIDQFNLEEFESYDISIRQCSVVENG